MADQTNKYSDPELNPSNKDYEERVNHSSNNSNDDSVVAHDLRRSEEGLGPIQKRLQRRDNEQQALREAEAAEWNDPQNRFGYKPDNMGDTKVTGSTRRKNAAKLGAAGGVIGLVLAMFGMLLPLKIPGIMQMISMEAGQRVEEVTERRATLIIARAIAQKSGSGVVVTGSGPISTLIASMRTKGFEKKLEAKGLKIDQTPNGVRLTVNGEKLDNGAVYKNDIEVLRALDGNRVTNKIIKDIVREEIPSWRWMKKAKFAKWLRIKYGIPRYGLTNNKEADPEEAAKKMEADRLKTETAANSVSNGLLMTCVSSPDSGCELVDDGSEGDSSTKSENQQDVTGEIDELNSAAVDIAAEGSTEDASKFITSEMTKKFAAKAIPIVGWIDLLATISHLIKVEAEDDYIGKAVAGLKERNQAQLYGFWSGYASQFELGAMLPNYGGKLAKQTEGIEKAQAFSYVQGTTISGNPITLFNDTAYATTANDIPGVPVDRIDSNNPGAIKAKLDSFNGATGGAASFAGKPVSEVLEVWYQTLGEGGILGFVGEWIGKGFSTITPGAVEEWAAKLMEKGWAKLLEIFGLDFNPFISGAKWFNNAHGGATASFNTFGRDVMGLRKFSPTQASIQNRDIAAKRAEDIRQKGVFYALFSSDVNSSITTQLAVSMPTDVPQFATSMANLITKSPQRLFGGLTPNVKAANPYVDLYGVDPYGATESDLSQPLAEEAISGDECPEVTAGDYNNCLVDKNVAEAMLCEFEPESEGCAGGGDETSQTAVESVEFTVASYNILHSESHPGPSIDVGGCRNNPVQGDPVCMKTRADRQIKIINGEMDNPAFDIFGTQETSPAQFDYLKSKLPSYAAFPESTQRMNNAQDGAVSVFWNTSKFTMFENGKAPGKSNTARDITNPWVGLQTANGQKIYVMSIHYAQNACSDGNCFNGTPQNVDDANMKESSELTEQWIRSKAAEDNIVIVMGDFNDTLRQKLSYCIYTKDSLTQHAVDMTASASLTEGCNEDRFNGIDHIYATPTLGLKASNWTHMPDTGEIAKASDHTPVYTTYTIPGSTTNTGAGSNFRLSTFNITVKTNESGWSQSVKAMVNNKLDIIGTQELEKDANYFFIQEKMKAAGYGIYPDKKRGENIVRHGLNARSILYKADKFDLIKTDMFRIPRYDDGPARSGSEEILAGQANVPIVWLQDKSTQQTVIVMNTHNVAFAQYAKRRYESALIYVDQVKRLQQENPGVPIFLTGDFNEGTGVRSPPTANVTFQGDYKNLLYCMFAENKLMFSAETLSLNRKMTCPNQSIGGVDYLYIPAGTNVSNFTTLPRSISGSDHPARFVDVAVPGGVSGSQEGWVWPFARGYKPGPCWGKVVGSLGKHAGVDINSDVVNNELLAMHDGTIVEASFDEYAGNYMKIKSTDGLYYTYQHMKSFAKQSGEVKAGEVVGIGGKTGRVYASSAIHLHLVVSRLNDFPSYGNLGGSIDPLSVLPKPAPEGYICY